MKGQVHDSATQRAKEKPHDFYELTTNNIWQKL